MKNLHKDIYYSRLATREDLRDIFEEAIKRAYQRGYRAGRKHI